MAKRRRTGAQRVASKRNLAKARMARRKHKRQSFSKMNRGHSTMTLYHFAPQKNVRRIKQSGFKGRTYDDPRSDRGIKNPVWFSSSKSRKSGAAIVVGQMRGWQKVTPLAVKVPKRKVRGDIYQPGASPAYPTRERWYIVSQKNLTGRRIRAM